MSSVSIYGTDPAKGWRPWGVLVPFLGFAFIIAGFVTSTQWR